VKSANIFSKGVSILLVVCFFVALPATAIEGHFPFDEQVPGGVAQNDYLQSEEDQKVIFSGTGSFAPVKSSSELKSSHEFFVSYSNFFYDKDADKETYHDVSFYAKISSGKLFLVDEERNNVFTVKNSRIFEGSSVTGIDKPGFVQSSQPRVECLDNPEDNMSHTIKFEVDFSCTKNKYTVSFFVRVFDRPRLEITTKDSEGETRVHYNSHTWLHAIDGDIWNSKIDIEVVRDSEENNKTVPVPGVNTKTRFFWGDREDASDSRCFFDDNQQATSDEDGIASLVYGSGGSLNYTHTVGVRAPELYASIHIANTTGAETKYYTFPSLKDFKGVINVKVVDVLGNPVPGWQVRFWGGAEYNKQWGAISDENGIAAVRYPRQTPSNDTTDLTMTVFPKLNMVWNLTQVIDNPSRIVKGHNAPLYLSPTVYVAPGYFEKEFSQITDVYLEVYDYNDAEKQTITRLDPAGYRNDYKEYPNKVIAGEHRAYIKVRPEDLNEKRLAIRALVKNKDDGAREEEVIIGNIIDPVSERQLYKAKKTFNFAFFPLKVGSGSATAHSGGLRSQINFIKKIFPAPINFAAESPVEVLRGSSFTHNLYLSRIFRNLARLQKTRLKKYDLIIGVTPPGFLGAAGLQQAGTFGMNWELFGAVKGGVLIDSDKTLPHTTLHEFIHTLGFSDVYPSTDWFGNEWRPASANGHDGAPINNIEGFDPLCEAIMYDAAAFPWPTVTEYNALLDYATVPDTKSTYSSMSTAEQEVMLISGMIEDTRSSFRRVELDPVETYFGEVEQNTSYQNYDHLYFVQTVDAYGNYLHRHYFSDMEHNGRLFASFFAALPNDEKAVAVEVWEHPPYGRNLSLLKRHEFSDSAPILSNVTFPAPGDLVGDFTITWQAAGGEYFTGQVEASTDGGASWSMLAMGIPKKSSGSYSYTVNAADLVGSDNYKFKVVVTDGMKKVEAVSDGIYSIQGFEQKPQLVFSEDDAEITVHTSPETEQVFAYVELANEGDDYLKIEFLQDGLPALFPTFFEREHIIQAGERDIIPIPLQLPEREPDEEFAEYYFEMHTNDTENEVVYFTVNVHYTEDELAPSLAKFAISPNILTDGKVKQNAQIYFDAYALLGRNDLDVSLFIENISTKQTLLNENMTANYHKAGMYSHFWNVQKAPEGEYGGYFALTDTNTGLRRRVGDYDFTFSIESPNSAPIFTTPKSFENYLGTIERGGAINIPFTVVDPEGDDLEITFYADLINEDLTLSMTSANSGIISGSVNFSGLHTIYLTATDTHQNSTDVAFYIAELEDLDIFSVEIDANDNSFGQTFGDGIYPNGEVVTVEAVPASNLYEFDGWMEGNNTVSADAKYSFAITGNRNLVAKFSEKEIFGYEIENGEVTITVLEERLADIVIPNEIEGYPVTRIDDRVFLGKGIQSVKLPETLTHIGEQAFSLNNLTEVRIPKSVVFIADYAFTANWDLETVAIFGSETEMGDYAFGGNGYSLTIYGIPNSTAKIFADNYLHTFKDLKTLPGLTPYGISNMVFRNQNNQPIDEYNPNVLSNIVVTVCDNGQNLDGSVLAVGVYEGKKLKSIAFKEVSLNQWESGDYIVSGYLQKGYFVKAFIWNNAVKLKSLSNLFEKST